jgi:hypothetical protein
MTSAGVLAGRGSPARAGMVPASAPAAIIAGTATAGTQRSHGLPMACLRPRSLTLLLANSLVPWLVRLLILRFIAGSLRRWSP